MTSYNNTEVVTKGFSPKLLILSGMHGDEHEVIDSVKKSVQKYWKLLPEFIFVPEASPSAVRSKTRINKAGVDLNRSFYQDTKIQEALMLMNIVNKNTFDVCWDFHEDPELSEFYIYDSGSMKYEEKWISFTKHLQAMKIKLFTGIDDPTDSNLGFQINEGYVSIPHLAGKTQFAGMFSEWTLEKNIVKRYLNPEIPGNVSQEVKDNIVELLFRHFLIK